MSDKLSSWNIHNKPHKTVCPKSFCFLWSEVDNKCRATLGICSRNIPDENNKDWYEPCEPELEKHGLPWFYFIPDANHLVDELREEYKRESNKIWID